MTEAEVLICVQENAREVLNLDDDPGPDEDLKASYDADSLNFIEMIMSIERELGLEVPDEVIDTLGGEGGVPATPVNITKLIMEHGVEKSAA
jgi:acyl carrier protein